MPQVSVITPCFNCEGYVAATMTSVRDQTFRNWEHVIVDDGSTDASAAVVEQLLAMDRRTRLIRKANGGVATARNVGYKSCAADGEFLLFLDADDVLRPGMLATLVEYLETRPNVGMVYCQHGYIDADGATVEMSPEKASWGRRYIPSLLGVHELRLDSPRTPFASILGGAGIAPSMSLIRRSVYAATPGWDEEFGHVHEDADLFLHIALRSEVHYLPATLVDYRRHQSQATNDPDRAARQAGKLRDKWRDPKGRRRNSAP